MTIQMKAIDTCNRKLLQQYFFGDSKVCFEFLFPVIRVLDLELGIIMKHPIHFNLIL